MSTSSQYNSEGVWMSAKLASKRPSMPSRSARLIADQKRYELDTTTIFFVLASQNDLAVAAGVLVREPVNYRRNLLNLYQSTVASCSTSAESRSGRSYGMSTSS